MITDNVLIAYEMNHFIQNKRSGEDGYAALKLDMSKAYNRVEWPFMEKIMRRLGFHERWIRLIMTCITTVTYHIRVNGGLTEQIIPSRGLRQGIQFPRIYFCCVRKVFHPC